MPFKRVLFVCGDYYPYPSANGVCVLRLQDCLLKMGFLSDVICTGISEENMMTNKYGQIHFVKSERISGNKVKRKIISAFKLLTIWPIKDSKLVSKYISAIQTMRSRYHYDFMVSVLRPIEGSLACCEFEKFVLYELDSITNNYDNTKGIKKLFSYRSKKIEKRIYQHSRLIFHLNCNKDYYSDQQYDFIRDKFIFTDIPHLVERNNENNSGPQKIVRLMFTGALEKSRNSPEYAIILIENLISKLEIKCDFFSRGDCENILKQKEAEYPKTFFSRGYVSQDELKEAVKEADFFLSIGSHFSGKVTSIPSKVIEYMSTGKPIIHIIGTNDTAIPYLKSYGNSLLLSEHDPLNDNIVKLENFIRVSWGKRVKIADLRNIFPMNTPEWTIHKMLIGVLGDNYSYIEEENSDE